MATVTERNRANWKVSDIFIDRNVFGNTWYVDGTNGDNTNTGKDPGDAFSTLAQARSSSSAGDTIVIAPGTYTVDVGTDGSLAPKADQKWVAGNPSYGGAPSVVIIADADDNVAAPVAVDVDNVVFEDIEFRLVAGGATALYILDAGQTTAVRGLVFKNCWFNLNSVDASVIAMRLNDATNAVLGISMKKCRFIGGDATTSQARYIQIGIGGVPDGLIEDNTFMMESADGDCLSLDFLDPGAAGGSYGLVVKENDFIGPKDGGGDAIAITVAAAMTEDEIVGMFRNNYMSNCTASITVDKINNSVINNYAGDNNTGGTLVDPGT